jgi:hypothetical protein
LTKKIKVFSGLDINLRIVFICPPGKINLGFDNMIQRILVVGSFLSGLL